MHSARSLTCEKRKMVVMVRGSDAQSGACVPKRKWPQMPHMVLQTSDCGKPREGGGSSKHVQVRAQFATTCMPRLLAG